jgi:hypothetical protein
MMLRQRRDGEESYVCFAVARTVASSTRRIGRYCEVGSGSLGVRLPYSLLCLGPVRQPC